MATCSHCSDTGSLSRDAFGSLDCTFCTAANEREALDKFARHSTFDGDVLHWKIYQRGKAAGAAPLLVVLQSFPGFTDDATVGDPWAEQRAAAIAAASNNQSKGE